MATIGLKIAQDPDTGGALSLADTLAKATFGDPEGQMKARALASEVGVRMASRDKLLADTGLIGAKTKTEQDAEAARLNAGPLVGEAGASAVPAIVDPNDAHEVAVHNALVARERALGPVLVLGDNPNATAEGINKNFGGTILSAAAANPAIVSGDSLRIAGGLSTGSAPSTSTVWSAGDTSGVDAAAREKILEKQAESTLPEKPHDVTYRGQPGQTYRDANGKLVYVGATGTETTPEKPNVHDYRGQPGVVTLDANGNPLFTPAQGTAPTAEKPKTFTGPDGKTYAEVVGPDGQVHGQLVRDVGDAPVKPLDIGKDTMLPPDPNDPTGTYRTPKTDRPPAAPTTPFAESKGDEGIAFNTVLTIANRAAHGETIGNDDARLYATTYNRLFGPKWDQKPDAQGVLRWVVAPGVPPPPGMVLPAPETFLGGQPPATQPPATPPPVAAPPATPPPVAAPPATPPPVAAPPATQPPATAPPVVAGGQVFPNDAPKPTPATESQSKARQFLPSLQIATQTLDKYNKKNMPSTWELGYTTPSEELGTFGKYVEASPAISDNARRFGSAANQWTSAQLYDLSGAAIGKGEFDRSVRGMLPRPNDPDDLVATKTKLRHAFLDAVANTAYANDPKVLALLAQGRSLNLDGSAAGPTTKSDSSAPTKRRTYDANGNLQ